MKTLKLAVLFSTLALLPMLASAQNLTLTGTTLVSAIDNKQTSFALTAVTNITGYNTNNNTDLYIDRELMQVISVNTTAKTVVVLRGVSGTQSAAHAASAIVVAGAPAAFLNYDPEGVCSTNAPTSPTANVPALPTINTRTGNQWLCSAATGQGVWSAGFANPGVSGTPNALSTATGATIAPLTPFLTFTGTTALVTITAPVGLPVGSVITIQFTGSGAGLTWTAAGNISVAGTSTTTLSGVTFTWTGSKWVPNRLA